MVPDKILSTYRHCWSDVQHGVETHKKSWQVIANCSTLWSHIQQFRIFTSYRLDQSIQNTVKAICKILSLLKLLVADRPRPLLHSRDCRRVWHRAPRTCSRSVSSCSSDARTGRWWGWLEWDRYQDNLKKENIIVIWYHVTEKVTDSTEMVSWSMDGIRY